MLVLALSGREQVLAGRKRDHCRQAAQHTQHCYPLRPPQDYLQAHQALQK